jgi:hypothetical protein
MLRTRVATALIALPALWLIVCYLPSALFAGFIMAVSAVALFEYFGMAFPEHRLERSAGLFWGLVIAGGVAGRRPELWGAGLAFTVISGLAFPLGRPSDLAGGVNRLGLSLLGVSRQVLRPTSCCSAPRVRMVGALRSSSPWGRTGRFGARRAFQAWLAGRRAREDRRAPSEGSAMAVAMLCRAADAPARGGLALGTQSACSRSSAICAVALKRLVPRFRLDYPRPRWHSGSPGRSPLPGGTITRSCRESEKAPMDAGIDSLHGALVRGRSTSCSCTSWGTSRSRNGRVSPCCASRSASVRDCSRGGVASRSTRSATCRSAAT